MAFELAAFVEVTLVTILFFGAGIIKGFFGVGLPPVILGFLTFLYDPRHIVSLMLYPILLSNARQALLGMSPLIIIRKHIWFLLISTLVIFATAYVSGNFSTALLFALTGTAMVLFAVTTLINRTPPLPENRKTPAQLVSGAISGLLGGVSGIWGPPMMMYLFALRLPGAELIQTIGIFFFFLSTFMALGLAAAGEMTLNGTFLSLVLVLPVILGMKIGEILRKKLSDVRFFRWFLVMFLFLGLNLIRRSMVN